MNILFYVHGFRDRDFWPIARSVVRAGHQIYYSIAHRAGLKSVVGADRVLNFDLVISSDKMTKMPDGVFVNRILTKRPPLLELILNDLAEIVTEYGGDDHSFSTLRQNKVTLGCLDRDLLESATAVGVPSAVYLQYGVQPLAIADAGYFPRRRGRRIFGKICPDDLAAPRVIDRALSRLAHTLLGYGHRRRTTDVVFLGECSLGPDPVVLEYIGTHFLNGATLTSLLATDALIREELAASVTEPPIYESTAVLTALTRHLPPCREGHMGKIGFLLMKEHYESQFRAARRLAYVRHLSTALGNRFHLYGDHFIKHGLPARPSDHKSTEHKYLGSKISIDFGSMTYGSSLDTRPTRIISCESLLLQLRRNDAGNVYGELADKMTYTSRDEMLAMVDSYLASPAATMSTVLEERALSTTSCGMDAIVGEFMATKPWSAPPSH